MDEKCFDYWYKSGIRKSFSKKIASEGYGVYAHARERSLDFEQDLQKCSQVYQVPIIPVYFDMLDTEKMKIEIKSIYRSNEIIDILVNNAGIAHGGLFRMTAVDEIRKIFNINLFSMMELTQLASRGMEKKRKEVLLISLPFQG